jgi:hypothetical protein
MMMKTTIRINQWTVLFLTALLLTATSFPSYVPAQADSKASQDELAQMLTAAVPQQGFPPIACDETKQGTIDQNDPASNNGNRFEAYSFSTQQANQAFTVTAQTTSFPLDVEVFLLNPQTQQFVFNQAALGPQNQQVKLSGTLATVGQYAVVVFGNTPQATGPFTLKLECKACSTTTTPGGTCTGGNNFQNAVQLQYDQTLSCELSANDASFTDQQGGVHYTKIFTFQAQAGSSRITVTTQAFTPLILVLNSQGQILAQGASPFTNTFQAGQVFIGVTSNEVQRPGAFTIQLARGGPF